jgi:N utilization substance protein A
LLEKFDMSLEEAQTLVMSARILLGWVDPADLVQEDAAGEEEAEEEAAEDRA